MKELSKDVDRERAAKETAAKAVKEKAKAVDIFEKRAIAAEKAKALAENRCVELLAKQNETDVKLAETESLNVAHAGELADMRVALGAAEEKWYHEGFADAENSVEQVVNQARRLGFEAGWFAALQAMGVPEDSPFRDPSQIPFPSFTSIAQSPPTPFDAEDTTSLRELVE